MEPLQNKVFCFITRFPSSYLSAYESLGSRLDLDKVRAQLFAHAKETDEKLSSIFAELHSQSRQSIKILT